MAREYENHGRWAGALIALVTLVVLALLVLIRFGGNAEDIMISDQVASSGVQVERVYFEEAGYITVHEDENGEIGEEIGRSELIMENRENIFVPLSRSSMPDERLHIVYHVDNGDRIFDSEEDEMRATRIIVITEVSGDNESENGNGVLDDENDSENVSFTGEFDSQIQEEENVGIFDAGGNELVIPVEITAGMSNLTISLMDFNFSEENLTIEQNTIVEFRNEEGNHTVTVEGTGINHSLREGESVSLKFNEAGTYQVYCEPHGEPEEGMHVTLFVVGNLSDVNESVNDSSGIFAEENFTMNDSGIFEEDNDSGIGSSADVDAGISDSGVDVGINAGADSGTPVY